MTTHILAYGNGKQLALDVADEALVADCAGPRQGEIASPAAALEQALCSPLEFPPLARAVVPGDHVVLALDKAVPRAAELVAALLEHLGAAGVEPSGATVVLPAGDHAAAEQFASLPLRVELHDPDSRDQLSYLAATPKGQPIYLNRTLVDADVVIPIGCLRGAQALGYHGVHGGLYPAFSDAKTLHRYRNPHLVEVGSVTWSKAQREVEIVDWLSGHPFCIQVVPAGGDDVLHVLAGHVDAVASEGQRLWEEAWKWQIPSRASLVVAGITGPPLQQNWENLAAALAMANAVVEPEGAIALCCDLDFASSPSIECLAAAEEPADAVRQIRRQRLPDALSALELAQVLDDVRVYLLSKLDEEFVEDLGMAAVAQPAEMARLASRHPSCLLISHAQHALVLPPGE